MTSVKLEGVPILRICAVPEAKQFYADYLGFAVDWEHYYEPGAPVYMQVSRAGLVLHLTENTRFKKGTIIFVGTAGIEELRTDLLSRPSAWQTPSISTTP